MPPVFIYNNMPAVNPNNASQGGAQRTTFRPPWVKEGPTPLPMPTAPWTARGREAAAAATVEEPKKDSKPAPRRLSKVTIIPSQPAENNAQEPIGQAHLKWNPKTGEKTQETPEPHFKPQPLVIFEKKQKVPIPGTKQPTHLFTEKEIFSQAILKPTPSKPKEKDVSTSVAFTPKRPSSFIKIQEVPGQSSGPGPREGRRRESATAIPVVVESKRRESTDKIVPVTVESSAPRERRKESVVQVKREPEKEPKKAAREFAKPVPKPVEKELPKSILKEPSKTSAPAAPKPPPPPPAPPMAPPLPPPPPPGKAAPIIDTVMTEEKAAKLEALRSRPRRRPDWTDMMKEVESGISLRHVQCNDRSAPILPKEKESKGQFVYESEKDVKNNPHKILLTQIQSGVKLKRVKCNDRSKPNLDGLRKFRRQMTIEEQIQKSMSMADVVAVAAEPDELDDIDKVRDDLQSTKQMLAQELRNKEALERENKRLMARLLNLEVELEKEKNTKRLDSEKGTVVQARSAADEKLVQQLKEEASESNRVAKEMEDKYRGTAEELDATRAKLESAWLRNQQLELELKAGTRAGPITKQPSSKKLAASMASMPNGKTAPESDEESEYTEETETETESEEEDNEVDAAAIQERRIARELKMLATKLRSYKDKQAMALKERHSLREQLRKQQKQLRQEKKKYKALQKEVDKMAKLMKDDEEEEEDEEEKAPAEEEDEEEEEETESESESEESEEDDPTDGDLPEDASVEDKRKNLTDRAKHHENRLGTLKKGNYLLKANIDRLQDDINRQREMSLSLQEDLNSVLAELG